MRLILLGKWLLKPFTCKAGRHDWERLVVPIFTRSASYQILKCRRCKEVHRVGEPK